MKTKVLTTIMMILLLASVAMIAVPVNAPPTVLEVGVGYPYATISAAVTAASPGDTIIVHAGTYNEQVSVPASLVGLTIKAAVGEDRPLVNGQPGGFVIWADYVVVEGFEVYATASPGGDGIAVKANYVVVRNNVVKGPGWWLTTPGWYQPMGAGISVINVHDVVVEGNSVHETSGAGIWVGAASYCTIRDNKVAETQYTGILLPPWGGNPSHHNTIEKNHVASAGTEWNYDDGIRLGAGAHDNVVKNNKVTASIRDGIRAVATTSGNEIAFNVMRGNGIPATGGVDAREQAPPGSNYWHDNIFRTSSGI